MRCLTESSKIPLFPLFHGKKNLKEKTPLLNIICKQMRLVFFNLSLIKSFCPSHNFVQNCLSAKNIRYILYQKCYLAKFFPFPAPHLISP